MADLTDASAKISRLEKANELLRVIAGCGRRFFCHEDRVSHFEFDMRCRLWFIDCYHGTRIYVAYTQGRWIGFSEGGTLRSLVIALRDYIRHGFLVHRNHFGPWPDWYCQADPWGYGEDMRLVREKAVELRICEKNSMES